MLHTPFIYNKISPQKSLHIVPSFELNFLHEKNSTYMWIKTSFLKHNETVIFTILRRKNMDSCHLKVMQSYTEFHNWQHT